MGCPEVARIQVISPHSLVPMSRTIVASEIRMELQSLGDEIGGAYFRRDFNSDEVKGNAPV